MKNIGKMRTGRKVLIKKLIGGYLEFYNKKISII